MEKGHFKTNDREQFLENLNDSILIGLFKLQKLMEELYNENKLQNISEFKFPIGEHKYNGIHFQIQLSYVKDVENFEEIDRITIY